MYRDVRAVAPMRDRERDSSGMGSARLSSFVRVTERPEEAPDHDLTKLRETVLLIGADSPPARPNTLLSFRD